MDKTDIKKYVADFETTVYDGQERTDVWAAAIIDMSDPDDSKYVCIMHSIDAFMSYIDNLLRMDNCIVYFHNLKFDGSFILSYLASSKYWHEYSYIVQDGRLLNDDIWHMPNKNFCYSITDRGIWYTLRIKNHGHYCEFRDSLKLLPFSVRQIGKGFNTKHQKLEMEYEGIRYPGCLITDEEKEYIANDVLVVKEALGFMFKEGHTKLTIGSCCMAEYKQNYKKPEWEKKFPDLYQYFKQDEDTTVGEWIRHSYKGGWCYVVSEKAGKEYNKIGTTADVNSLYPSMMHSASGNYYPIGEPHYFKGDVPDEAKENHRYYFVKVKTRFYIKENMLPTIQIKGNPLYYGREWLKTSDVRYKGQYFRQYTRDNKILEAIPTLYLTMTDWELLKKHYNLEDTEIIEGYWFETEIGLFDDYINKWAEIKKKSKGPMRQLAKLFLNNLYGKFATSPENAYKIEYLDEDDILRSYIADGDDKTPGYIAIGSAITSYARRFTITAAQANYYGPDKPGFIYADTDSIHCDLTSEEIKDAPKHPTEFNHWKYETTWNYAKFIRAKTYVERVIAEDEEPIENPYYNMKCAGMSDHVKNLFIHSVLQDISEDSEEFNKLDNDEKEFIKEQRTFDDFQEGLRIPGMLKAKQIPGGTLLVKGDYEMRPILAL